MIISVASGKGGTGKTTLSLAISSYIAKKGGTVQLLDCDVEEPNANLFLKTGADNTENVYSLVPAVDNGKCSGCGKCGDICAFNAIVMIKDKPLVFPDLCHSCGGCMLVCEDGAISEIKKEIGTVERGSAGNIDYTGGRLKIGEVLAPHLIKAVKEHLVVDGLNIIDSPPGTSCPVIEAVSGSDYVILVTEPTPFGLHDLRLAVEMIRELGLSLGVVINRCDSGDARVEDYCKEEKIDIIAGIPDSREIAESYSKGELVNIFIEKFSGHIEKILAKTGAGRYVSGGTE